MSTSLAISSAALAQSSAALAAAERAERTAKCDAYMRQPDLTTTFGRQTYASCVNFMEPRPSAETPQHMKATIGVLVLIILIVGFINAWRKRKENDYVPVLGFVMETFMGCAFAGIVIGLIIGLIVLAGWVLT